MLSSTQVNTNQSLEMIFIYFLFRLFDLNFKAAYNISQVNALLFYSI